MHFEAPLRFEGTFCSGLINEIVYDELGDVLDSMIETGGMSKEEYQAKLMDFVCSL